MGSIYNPIWNRRATPNARCFTMAGWRSNTFRRYRWWWPWLLNLGGNPHLSASSWSSSPAKYLSLYITIHKIMCINMYIYTYLCFRDVCMECLFSPPLLLESCCARVIVAFCHSFFMSSCVHLSNWLAFSSAYIIADGCFGYATYPAWRPNGLVSQTDGVSENGGVSF